MTITLTVTQAHRMQQTRGVGPLPSLHMERREGLERSLAGEELEATLRVLDPSHAEEPHQEVKAVHEKRTEH